MSHLPFISIALVAACAAPATPPPAQPRTVATVRSVSEPGTPEGPRLIHGTMAIAPDAATKERARAEYTMLRSSWKVCVEESGEVGDVEKLQSSGFPDYDAAIRREITTQWRFERPPARTCKAMTFVFPLDA